MIQESNSEWASAPVLVRKKDGTVRYCVDFRVVNDLTVKDAYGIPSISQCLDQLEGCTMYSCLDLASGYHQILIDERDRHKTAFITKFGLFEHKRMAFGLCNAPSTFSRVIGHVLRGLTWKQVLAYLDDVIVLGRGFDDQLGNLRMTFDRFRRYNLKLKPKKCDLFCTEVTFLGKKVSPEGVAVNPINIEKVQKWPLPRCKKDVEKFLGFANYHREHIKEFSHIASPLYGLTKRGTSFVWCKTHQTAFDHLVKCLTTAPVLAYPNPRDLFILDTDASDECIGAELVQIQDGIERVISYGSFVLTPEQRKYCTTRKELLAVVRFTRQYRHYLLGQRFLIRTDHNSLTWLLRFKNADGQLARWLEELSQFDMAIIHRKGVRHTNADGLSRIPDTLDYCDCYRAGIDISVLPCAPNNCQFCKRAQSQWRRFEDDVDDVIPLALKSVIRTVQSKTTWVEGYSQEDLCLLQEGDGDIAKLRRWLGDDNPPTQHELKLSSPAVRYFWIRLDQLVVRDNLLHFRVEESGIIRSLLIVPHALRQAILHLNHDVPGAGHLGISKTTHRVRKSFMWYGLTTDVVVYVKSCSVCNRNKKANVKAKASLGTYHAGYPGDRVHVDILGPFTLSHQGNQYVLMVVDQFTKWLECFPLPQQSAEVVARTIVDGFIARLGCPIEIHTDQGRQFEGSLFAAVCDLLEVSKTRTTPYHPSSNGQVERYNRTLLQMIRCHIKGNPGTWDECLQQLAGAVRSTINRQTGFTPNMMMYGREVVHPADLMLGTFSSRPHYASAAPYVKDLRHNLEKVHARARLHLESSQARQKKDYDFKLRENRYQVGDVVYQLDSSRKKGQSPKLKPIWKGPFLVVTIVANHVYRLASRKKETTVHHDRLKLCEDRDLPLWLKRRRHVVLGENLPLSLENPPPEDHYAGIPELFSEPDPPARARENPCPDGAISPLSGESEVVPLRPHPPQKPCSVPKTIPSSLPTATSDDCPPPASDFTRRGRKVRPPTYLSDYSCTYSCT